MWSKKLSPNGKAAPEGSVGRHGNRWTNGIVLALSGLAAVVSFVALLFLVQEINSIRDQQMAFMKQQEDLRKELQGLKDQLLLGPASSTEDWRRDHSATFWKSAKVHRRSKRNSEANTVLILGKRSDLGCLSGAPARDGPSQVTTPAATRPPPTESDCAAYKAAGHTTSGVYTLGSPLSGVTVYCDMDTAGGGWTVIQRRLDGSVPFNKNWEEYKQGFGNKNGEYWLGNENIHLLTASANYRLRIDMTDWDDQTRYMEYNTFRVAGESDWYRLTIGGGYSGNAGESIIGSHRQRFSTIDRDYDGAAAAHCSAIYGHSGWWFSLCGFSNLNGRYLGNCADSCSFQEGVVWAYWKGFSYSLKSVSMKIRP
ncbi:Fibrinogen- domains (FReDs) [Branchiostoma belcheri]|nr:Fibrinogen- domains (FReDs) [Branchiostoma belcheri]